VPFVFWGAGVQADAATSFTEAAGAASSVQLAGGPELMPRFLDRPMRT
jgi:2,3-bisphosphoglycerate-independent phosphoglycerate mutase